MAEFCKEFFRNKIPTGVKNMRRIIKRNGWVEVK